MIRFENKPLKREHNVLYLKFHFLKILKVSCKRLHKISLFPKKTNFSDCLNSEVNGIAHNLTLSYEFKSLSVVNF